MQKLSLALSVVAIALSVVFFFLGKSSQTSSSEDVATEVTMPSALQGDSVRMPVIAFVKGDSINAGYRYIIDKQQDLLSSSKISEGKLQSKLGKAEKEYQDLMAYVQSGSASESDMQAAQERIMQLQYELQQAEAEEQNKLLIKEQEIQQELVERLDVFLKKFAAENNIDIILNWGISGEGILYGSEPFDVTQMVLDGLNNEYAMEKLSSEPK
jgi:outer membrane protein